MKKTHHIYCTAVLSVHVYILFTKHLSTQARGACCKVSTSFVFKGQYRHISFTQNCQKDIFCISVSFFKLQSLKNSERKICFSFHKTWLSLHPLILSLIYTNNTHTRGNYGFQCNRDSTCNPLFVKLLLFILYHLCCLNGFPWVSYLCK